MRSNKARARRADVSVRPTVMVDISLTLAFWLRAENAAGRTHLRVTYDDTDCVMTRRDGAPLSESEASNLKALVRRSVPCAE